MPEREAGLIESARLANYGDRRRYFSGVVNIAPREIHGPIPFHRDGISGDLRAMELDRQGRTYPLSTIRGDSETGSIHETSGRTGRCARRP